MSDIGEPTTGTGKVEEFCISTRAHGEVWFEASLSGHRERILAAREDHPRSVEAATFVDNLAAACVAQLGGRKFEASNEGDDKALTSLHLELADDERMHFAARFLEANDFLLCKAESTNTVGADGERLGSIEFVPRNDIEWKPGPVEKLHQAWLLHLEEEAAWVRKTLGPTISSDLGASLVSRWNHRTMPVFLEGTALGRTREPYGVRFLSELDETTKRLNEIYKDPALKLFTHLDVAARGLREAYGEPALKMFTQLNTTAKALDAHFGNSVLPALSALDAKMTIFADQHQTGLRTSMLALHSTAESLSKFAATVAPPALELATGTASWFERTNLAPWWSQDLATWRRFGAGATHELRLARATYDSATAGVIGSLASSDLIRDTRLTQQLLGPSHSYTTFVADTMRMKGAAPALLRATYDSVLSLGAAHLDRTYGELGRLVRQRVEPRVASAEDEPSQDRMLNLLPQQRDELVARPHAPREGQLNDSPAVPSITEFSLLVSRVLALVADCNDAAQVGHNREIFTPTNRVLRAFANLTQMVPTNRSTFGDAVDDLYFVIYEGAGSDHLRFLEGQGGVLQETDPLVRPVFDIKFLRNKWLRHDPDHGEPGKIEKSWEAVRETLQSLGLSFMPTAPEHFRLLYHQLLRDLAAFLERLLSRLQAK